MATKVVELLIGAEANPHDQDKMKTDEDRKGHWYVLELEYLRWHFVDPVRQDFY